MNFHSIHPRACAMPCQRRMPTLLWVLAMSGVSVARALSAASAATITILQGSDAQLMPFSYCERWPTWSARTDAGDAGGFGMSAVPCTDGFVSPTSVDELWVPQDLPALTGRPALGAVVCSGEVRQIFPSVHLEVKGFRNFGLASLPRARTWLDFRAAGAMRWDLPRLSVFARDREGAEWRSLLGAADDAEETEAIATEGAFAFLVELLAREEGGGLGDGFHIVDVPLPAVRPLQPLPTPAEDEQGARLCAFFSDEAAGSPRELLERDELGLNNCALLDVSIVGIAPGSTSEYMPDCYRPLYGAAP